MQKTKSTSPCSNGLTGIDPDGGLQTNQATVLFALTCAFPNGPPIAVRQDVPRADEAFLTGRSSLVKASNPQYIQAAERLGAPITEELGETFMKFLILSASILISMASVAMASDAPFKVIFGLDQRPADGDLVEITFTRNFSDLYAATLHIIPGGLYIRGAA